MGLEDEADVQAQLGQLFLAGPQQFLAKDAQAAVLTGAQAAEHGQQGGFARAGRAGANDDLAWINVQADVLEGMFAFIAAAKPVIDMLEGDDRFTAGFPSHRIGGSGIKRHRRDPVGPVCGWPGCRSPRTSRR